MKAYDVTCREEGNSSGETLAVNSTVQLGQNANIQKEKCSPAPNCSIPTPTESVLGAAIRLERKRFRTKTRVNTVTRYYGTMRRFAGETGAASLGNNETSATRSGYTTLPRKCEQRH
ncbi:hypothetical protein AVEN_206761-1 [Araneus ventricosus]|uniref:Uncharacterized protein n=1 Tax=Araneus ventricosus TaxID=182803 RepID=A0A4Y2C4E4_ARAVE|nr:hypothetical protein AVEN_206761-1 [Araneus ventricosus]